MTEITKPTDLNKIWAATGSVLVPDDTKISTGWVVEAPSHQTENYLNKKHDTALAYLNQHGLPQWDSGTEYIISKSWVQGSNGAVYFCKQTHINQNPVSDTLEVYWRLILSGTQVLHVENTTTYSKGWLASSISALTGRGNLGITSAGDSLITATTTSAQRTALGAGTTGNAVFLSSTQNDGKSALGITSASDTSEGLVERATDAETITGVDDTRFLTPKKLRLGFSINLANDGHIAFPTWMGGLIINWGSVYVADQTQQTSFFSKPFPTAMLQAVCSPVALGISGTTYAQKSTYSWINNGNISIGIQSARDGSSGATVSWFAIGY
jgi:hypothetical protein